MDGQLHQARRSFFAALASDQAWGPRFHASWLQQNVQEHDGPLTEIPAEELRSWILAAQKGHHELGPYSPLRDTGRVELDERGIKIQGPLNITGDVFNLAAVHFSKPIRIWNCSFDGDIRIDDAELKRLVLDSCSFRALFGENSVLKSNLEIKRCTVEHRIWLIRTDIEGHLNLEGTTINEGNTLPPKFLIDGREITDEEHRVLRCEGAEVRGGLLMRRGFAVHGNISLRRASILGVLRTTGAKFRGLEPETIRPDEKPHITLDLRGATIGGTLDLTGVTELTGGLDLRDTRARAFADDRSAWPEPGKLLLDGFTYERLTDSRENKRTPRASKDRLHWLRLQWEPDLYERFKPQPWTRLAKVLTDMGHDHSAKTILFEREKWRNRQTRKNPLTKSLVSLLGLIAGHGYRSHRAFVGMGIAWTLAFFLFSYAEDFNLVSPSQEVVLLAISDEINSPCITGPMVVDLVPPRYPSFNPAVFAVDTIVPITNFEQTDFWVISSLNSCHQNMIAEALPTFLPHEVKTQIAQIAVRFDIFRSARWFFVAVGWLLTTIAVAGITGILERDRK